jgi:ABC-2 type transport system permease protein
VIPAVRAEWTKLRTVRTTAWTVLAILGLTVGLGAALTAGSDTTGTGTGDNDIVRDSLVGVYAGQIGVVGLATLAITSEYATGMILTTVTAIPRRRTVLAAKAVVVGVTVLIVGMVSTATAFVLGQHLLRGGGFRPPAYPEWTLADGPALRAVVGTALFLTALALLSLGVGAILRSTAGTISVLLAVLFIPRDRRAGDPRGRVRRAADGGPGRQHPDRPLGGPRGDVCLGGRSVARRASPDPRARRLMRVAGRRQAPV